MEAKPGCRYAELLDPPLTSSLWFRTHVHSTSSSLADRTSVAYLGTFVRRGRGRAVVVATAEYTEFGKVFEMLQEVEDQKTPLQVKMDGLGKTLSVFSFAIIGFIVLVGVFQGRNAAEMFTIGVSLYAAAGFRSCAPSIPATAPDTE